MVYEPVWLMKNSMRLLAVKKNGGFKKIHVELQKSENIGVMELSFFSVVSMLY